MSQTLQSQSSALPPPPKHAAARVTGIQLGRFNWTAKIDESHLREYGRAVIFFNDLLGADCHSLFTLRASTSYGPAPNRRAAQAYDLLAQSLDLHFQRSLFVRHHANDF
jgi:hypothetical protein